MNYFDYEAESAILGAMFQLDALKLDEVLLTMNPEMFYDPKNAIIYQSIKNLAKEEKPIDVLTVSDELRKMDMFEKVGTDYLLEIYTGCSTFDNVLYYCKIVKDMAIRRKIIFFGKQLEGIDPYEDIEEIIGQFDKKKDEIFNDMDMGEVNCLGDDVMAEMSKPPPKELFKTGLYDLDDYVIMEPETLVCIGGDPGIGKSSLALNLALKACQNNKVFFVSLEMKRRKLFDRLTAIKTKKSLDTVIKPDTQRICWHDLYNLKNLYFNYGELDSIDKIAIRNFKLKADVIIIDNNMLIDTGIQNPEQHHMKIVRDIKKKLVTHQKCLVFLICHLNRNGKESDPPTNRSLYQPEYFRQADYVWMLYSKDLENHQITDDKEHLILRITKARDDRTTRIPVLYKESTCTFLNVAKEL